MLHTPDSPLLTPAPVRVSAGGISRATGDYLELTKPRITVFILMSTAIGFLCGEHIAGSWNWLLLLHTLLGTALIASGTAALNQWYERAADAKMVRTRKRPDSQRTPDGEARFCLWRGAIGRGIR